MALPSVFPIYPESINGPYHVSLSLPGMQSEILKSVGKTASSLLLVPQVDYIKKFVEGDLDIGDSVIKGMISHNFSAPEAAKNEEVFKRFAKLSKIEIEDINKYKKGDKFVMPTSEINLSPEWENIGLSSVEKTTLKSIFETQKPYIEIAKIVLETLASVEDIIARVMPLVSLNPLTCKSEKPNSNSGKNSRPKAMGFNNGEELKKELSKLETIINNKKPEQKLKLDNGVVDEYFKISANGEKQKRASQSERQLLSKYTILIALFERSENFFDFVYSEIVNANGVESVFRPKIQNFLNDISSTYKNLKIYQTSNPIEKVTLNTNDVVEIIKSAQNKFKFKNNQNIPNSTYLNIYKETALKFYREKVPLSMVPENSTDDPNTSASPGNWKVINTIYSTGEFKPDVEYTFSYVDLPSDDLEFEEKKSDLDLGDTDPYHKYKPKKIILGIYKSDGTPLNPTENVKTIGLSGTDVIQVNTPFKKAEWVLRSPKWHLPTGLYQWPVYDDPIYVWEKGLLRRESKTNPDPGADIPWRIKKYKKGDKDLLSNEDALPGNPVIAGIERNEQNEYREFFDDFLKFRFHKTDTLTKREKINTRKDIMGRLNIQSHVSNVFNYGQAKSSFYKPINGKDPVPNLLKKSFKPYKIFSTEASVDPEIRDFSIAENLEPGHVWIEPEADYDMKVIRIDPADKISYFDAKGEPEVSTQITNFVKNRLTMRLSNNAPFTIEIRKSNNQLNPTTNNQLGLSNPEIYENITSFSLDNWNYSNSKVFNSNLIRFTIYSTTPPGVYNNIQYKAIDYVSRETGTASSSTAVTFEFKKDGNEYFYRKKRDNVYSFFSPGDIVLWSNSPNDNFWDAKYCTRVRLDDKGKIIRWYYQKDRVFSGPNSKLSRGSTRNIARGESINQALPTFGVSRQFVINTSSEITNTTKDYIISYTDDDFSLYNIKVSDSDPLGKIIDPSKITNDQLTQSEIFGFGKDGLLSKYGHGSEEEPQELLILQRYRLTDLDTESYYIIEGTLRNPPPDGQVNAPNAASAATGGNNYYRLPDAIGAIKVFLTMLSGVFAKLLPKIVKLIALFKNPMGFITDIITEKLQESVSFLSKKSLDTFKTGRKLKNELEQEKDLTEKKKKVRDMKKFYKSSPLSNYVFVKDDGKALSVLDSAALIPFSIFGSSLNFGMEMNLGGLLENKNPLKLIFEKDLNLKNMRNLQKDLNLELKSQKNTQGGINLKKSDKEQPSLKSSAPKNPNDTGDFQVKFDDGSEKTIKSGNIDNFVLNNKSRYNFVYLDENKAKTYKKIDEYIAGGSAEDLKKAKELLDKAQKENPSDDSLQDKLNLLKGKLGELGVGEHPMLKMILGIVTLPVKIIAGVLEWLLNFFKGLINPLTLPTKIIELVSFQWIMKFFTPKGILEIAGIKFKPEKSVEWATKVNIPGIPTPNLPEIKTDKLPDVGKFDIPNPEIPKFDTGNIDTKLTDVKKDATDLTNKAKIPNDLKTGVPNVPSVPDIKSGAAQIPAVDTKSLTDKMPSLPGTGDLKSNLPSGTLPPLDIKSKLNLSNSKVPELPKSLNLPEDIVIKGYNKKTIKSGDFLAPDDVPLADLSEFLNVAFNVKLPTYSALQFRQNPKLALPLLSAPGGGGFLCLIEKIINGIIDFVWATLGIEALIPPPHIKLCDQKSNEDKAKIKDNTGTSGATSSTGGTSSNVLDGFFYEVVLENGETKNFLNQEELQAFIDENKDFNYDFNF